LFEIDLRQFIKGHFLINEANAQHVTLFFACDFFEVFDKLRHGEPFQVSGVDVGLMPVAFNDKLHPT
jgi:hypothetical protein